MTELGIKSDSNGRRKRDSGLRKTTTRKISEGKRVALWSKRGKSLLATEQFGKFLNQVHFDLVECMYDDQNSAVESRKRIKKMHERTEQFVNLFFSFIFKI